MLHVKCQLLLFLSGLCQARLVFAGLRYVCKVKILNFTKAHSRRGGVFFEGENMSKESLFSVAKEEITNLSGVEENLRLPLEAGYALLSAAEILGVHLQAGEEPDPDKAKYQCLGTKVLTDIQNKCDGKMVSDIVFLAGVIVKSDSLGYPNRVCRPLEEYFDRTIQRNRQVEGRQSVNV